ncbi:MAG: enoyl-CoA hydratase/isomerase family protein [bacterium]
MDYEHVLFKTRGPVSWVVLNRPERLNAFNTQLAVEASDALRQAIDDRQTRVVVITGKGRAFSVGADVTEVAEDPAPPERIRVLATIAHDAVAAIRKAEKPVIAAINHQAAGYGMALALACDLRAATEKVRLYYAYSLIGLTGDGGINYLLPRMLGPSRALEVALTGEVIFEEEAAKLGLITKFFKEDSFLEDTQALAERVAACPPRLAAAIKRMMIAAVGDGLIEHLETEKRLLIEMAGTAEFRELAGRILGTGREGKKDPQGGAS